MGVKIKEVDSYIEKSAEFSKPILNHLRELVHDTCPQVEEKIKWGMPHFDYKGPFCHMAAFKQHCAFGFWKSALMEDFNQVMEKENRQAMGNLGKITLVQELPADPILQSLLMEAMRLNDEGIKLPSTAKTKGAVVVPVIPKDLAAALKVNPEAKAMFESMPPSHRKEYILHIEDAKTDATRQKRIQKTITQVLEKKSLNWKYMK